MITSLLYAFLLGGCMCVAFQVIGDCTKAAPPKILLVGIGAGALLAALGITGALGSFSAAGIGVLVIGFGEAVFGSTMQMLAGNALPALTMLVVVLLFWVIGVASGALRLRIAGSQKEEE